MSGPSKQDGFAVPKSRSPAVRRARPIVSVVAAVALLGAPLGLAAAAPAAGTAAESDAPVVLTGRWAPVAVADRLQPWLARALATSDGSRLRVMVSGETTDAAVAAVRTAGLEVQQTWDKAGVVAAAGTPDQVRAVVPLPGVTYVEGDQELEYTLDTAHEATRSEQALATYKASDGSRVDGSGVTIAVIDSGVDGTHPMFADAGGVSKVVQNRKNACGIEVAPETNEACFVQPAVNDTDTESVGGHGTHVAGIAAGYEVETEYPAGTRLR